MLRIASGNNKILLKRICGSNANFIREDSLVGDGFPGIAYLTTDLIQPGIIHIIREFEADVALAPASVSLYL
jgi:hypothetical protein